MSQVPSIRLSDGTTIPQLGFGTWELPDEVAEASVGKAFEVGYRHIDTAAIYGNEEGVGRAIAASGLPRGDIYLTTKIWNDSHLRSDARRAIETSLTKLGVDHVDLYLIHWPATVKYGDSYIECWDALQEFRTEGLVTSIGVCNFEPHHLDALNGARPVLDQIELHPRLQQRTLRSELANRGIAVESWSPLGRSTVLAQQAVQQVSGEVGRTPGQVVLKWHLQQGLIVIPRSKTPSRIEENFDLFDFELTDDQMGLINSLDDPDGRTGKHPDTAEF